MNCVIWKTIDGFDPEYEASEFGYVRSRKYGKERLLKPVRMKIGYLCFKLRAAGKTKTILQHRLVAQRSIPNPNNLPQINHKNGIRDDNRVENLEWVTALENIRHANRTGLTKRGEKSGCSKFSDATVNAVYEEIQRGEKTFREIGKEFGMSQSNVSMISRGFRINGTSNGETKPRIGPRRESANGIAKIRGTHTKLNPDTVREIRAMHAAGTTVAQIADRLDRSLVTIYKVINGQTWAHVT